MGQVKKFRDTDQNAPIWVVRINKLLEKRQWTQKEFAQRVGVSPSTVSDWIGINREKPTAREPGIYAIQKIAECFGVSVDYILGGNECKSPSDEEIYKVIGLSGAAISKLKCGKRLVEKGNISAEKKLAVLTYLIENIGKQKLLEDMYSYLLARYHVENKALAEPNAGEFLITYSPSGKEQHFLAFNDIYAQASFVNVQVDIMKIKQSVVAEWEAKEKAEWEKHKDEYRDLC